MSYFEYLEFSRFQKLRFSFFDFLKFFFEKQVRLFRKNRKRKKTDQLYFFSKLNQGQEVKASKRLNSYTFRIQNLKFLIFRPLNQKILIPPTPIPGLKAHKKCKFIRKLVRALTVYKMKANCCSYNKMRLRYFQIELWTPEKIYAL